MGTSMWPLAKILLFVIIALAPCGAESDLAVVGPPAGEQTLAIIVNQSNPVENFSYEDLRKIFLGERSHWPNGRRITLVMLEASLERKVVLRDIYGMSEKDFDNHFIQGVFTGSVFVSPRHSRTLPMFLSLCSMCQEQSVMSVPVTWILR